MGYRSEELRVRLTPLEKQMLKVLQEFTGASMSAIMRGFMFAYLDVIAQDINAGEDPTSRFLAAIGRIPTISDIRVREALAQYEKLQEMKRAEE